MTDEFLIGFFKLRVFVCMTLRFGSEKKKLLLGVQKVSAVYMQFSSLEVITTYLMPPVALNFNVT